MKVYMVSGYGQLFGFDRVVEAGNVAEAAAQVDQTGLKWLWVAEVTDCE